MDEANRNARAYVYAAWSHEFTNDGTILAGFGAEPALAGISIRSVESSDNAASFGAGFHFAGTDKVRIFFGFDGETDQSQQYLTAHAGLRYSW
tara:strand:- start:920 stop:1198 length:279 start_codon:yes stop_codon:yes gene_type:complete